MAAQRPNVIVYQEYENLTVAPDIPDLNVLIVGPCYQILDYLDDKSDCYADDYGTLNSPTPLVDPSSVVLSSPPNLVAGGELQGDSITIYFDDSRVVLVESEAVAANYATFAADDNLFEAHTTSGGIHFAVEEVAAGDILNTQSQGTSDYIMTVKEVVFALNDYAGTLFFLDGDATYSPVQAGDIVVLSSDAATNPRDGTYTVTRVRDNNTLEFLGLNWIGNLESAMSGKDVTITVTDSSGNVRGGYPATLELADYCDLRTTADFPLANDGSNREWRVERDVDDIALDSTDYSVSSNQITIAAAITTDLSATLLAKKVAYAKIYVEYMALRTDLQDVTTLSNFSEMETTLGIYDSRNPLFVGAVVAKANTTTPIKVYGLKSDDLPGYLDFIDRISSISDIYAIVPLTYTTSILAVINSMCENLSDPNYALTNGIKQKFRMTLGAIDLVTEKYMVNAASGGYTETQAATAPTGNKTLTLVVNGTAPDFSALGVVPGDTIEVYDHDVTTTYTYTVAQLQDDAPNGVVEVEEVVVDVVGAASDTFKIIPAAGGTPKLDLSFGVAPADTQMDTTGSVLDNLYLIFKAAGADFITNSVVPGDYLQIPTNPTGSTWTTYQTWTVDEVLSQERLRIVNSGNNTSLLANELPHLYKRTDGSAITGGLIYFRVMRTLDKTEQVDEMIATASSFSSKRLVLCYPDLVDITSLVNGSLARTVSTIPELAPSQPGYYLACAVGGLTAGKPPQQGFTNMGIAGIDRVYNSTEYFTEELLTDLSNGGVYVFVQDTPAGLPYTIHEVTTDVTALEFSEYMVVKNFDFVSITFLDTMLPFLGEWNVLPETIEFIRQALFTTGDTLKSRYVTKIGAPLTDFEIDSVAISSLSTDRIEAYVDVDLPMTLNTIGLHLVA